MAITIIGIDCAVDPTKVGLALGTFSNNQTIVQDVQLGSVASPPEEIVVNWLKRRKGPALLALDAPLGWPVPMGHCLAVHSAGERLNCAAHDLFRRTTDLFVKREIGKQSLDVGADRIARTAWSALELLHTIRVRIGEEIPLAWKPDINRVSAIEVYPAATLAALGISAKAYKDKVQSGADARERVISAVAEYIQVNAEVPKMRVSSDGVDAVICTLAAQDFLMNQALAPPDEPAVKREGWIWVRQRAAVAV